MEFINSTINFPVLDYEHDEEFKVMVNFLKGAKGAQNTQARELEDFLNDLSWSQFTQFIYTTRHAQKRIEDVPAGKIGPRGICMTLQFPPYLLSLIFNAVGGGFEERNVHFIDQIKQDAEINSNSHQIFFHFMHVPNPGFWSIMMGYNVMQEGFMSATEYLLEQWI